MLTRENTQACDVKPISLTKMTAPMDHHDFLKSSNPSDKKFKSSPTRTLSNPNNYSAVVENYSKLNGFINNLEDKIDGNVMMREQEIMRMFQLKLFEMKKEIKKYKDRVEEYERRYNYDEYVRKMKEKIVSLEQNSQDYAKMIDEQRKTIQQMKVENETMKLEYEMLQKQFIHTVQRFKAEQNKEADQSKILDKTAHDSSFARGKKGALDTSLMSRPESSDSYRKPAKQLKLLKPLPKKTPEQPKKGEYNDNVFLTEQLENPQLSQIKSQLLHMYYEADKNIDTYIDNLAVYVGKIKEEKEHEMERLRGRIEKLKKEIVQNAYKTNQAMISRNDYEQLFIECVEEVRKEALLNRLRNFTSTTPNKQRNTTGDEHIKKVMMDKNDILLKTKDQLLTTQKKKILELFLTKDEVLMLLYKHLFPQKYDKFKLYSDAGVDSLDPTPSPNPQQDPRFATGNIPQEQYQEPKSEIRGSTRENVSSRGNQSEERPNSTYDMTKAVQQLIRARRPKPSSSGARHKSII